MRRALLACVIVLAACRTRAPAHPKDPPLDLPALAAAIDPGPQPPLTDGMPGWIAEALAGSAQPARDPGALADQLGGLVRGMLTQGSLSQQTLIDLLTAVYALAHVDGDPGCRLPCLLAAERAYAALDVPVLGDPDGFFAELIDAGLAAVATQGGDAAQVREVVDYLRAAIRAAPAHQLRVAARILREAPDGDEATQVLRDLTRTLADRGDSARAVAVARAVVTRSKTPGFDDVRAVARACVRDLQLACAEAWHARAAALAADPDQHASADRLAADLVKLRRVLAIGEAPEVELALERAHLLIELDLERLATPAFEALRAAHRDDARPVVGLVRAQFEKMRSSKAAALLAEARPLGHHDRQFYELALGMFFTRFMGELLPRLLADPDRLPELLAQVLPPLADDVRAFAAFAPGRAAVLAVVVARAQELLPLVARPAADQRAGFTALATGALVDTRALRVRFPDEADAARLAWVLTRFGGAPRGDFGVVDDPIPAGAEHDQLALMRAALMASLIVAWEDPGHLRALHAALDQLTATPATASRIAELQADALALDAAIGGDAAAWARAEAAYRARIPLASKDERGRLRNNLGVALWRRGAKDEAIAAWQEAIVDGDPVSVARLNLHANQPMAGDTLDVLAELGEQAERNSTRYQALRWHAARSGLTGAALADAEQKARAVLDESGFGITVSGSRGVILDESFAFGLGYSSTTGLVTNFGLTSSVWLLVTAP